MTTNFKVGDKVQYIKGGMIGWESEDRAEQDGLTLGSVYTVSSADDDYDTWVSVSEGRYNLCIRPDHFVLAKDAAPGMFDGKRVQYVDGRDDLDGGLRTLRYRDGVWRTVDDEGQGRGWGVWVVDGFRNGTYKEVTAPEPAQVNVSGGVLPVDAAARKSVPIATGCVDYFPDALVAVAELSRIGNEQHNPGKPLFWDRSKSTDEANALMRHFVERGKRDTDGVRHSAKVAWRALALLQKEIEAERA